EEVRTALLEDDKKTVANNNAKLLHINTQIKLYETKADKNYDMFLEGVISKDVYSKKNKELTKTIQDLHDTRKNIELMVNSDFSNALYLLELSRKAPDLFENAE